MSKSAWAAPQWVNNFYSKFPLVTLEQEEKVDWKVATGKVPYTLWVQPTTSTAHPHNRPWAASDPSSLRAQLLFLLRGVQIRSQSWSNPAAAPKGKLPTVHITKENRLVAADDIRGWLDTNHPLKGKDAALQGMPDQAAYDSALATAQLILVRLLPAYYASLSSSPTDLALMIPEPPALSAGLTTPLPASLTGDDRTLNYEKLVDGGIEAIEALHATIDAQQWAYGAASPTPLDALIASHLYCIYTLHASSPLRLKLEEHPELGQYIDRVLDAASTSL